MANNEVSDGEAERSLNPIACSHCRHRKRKCDRKLPHCLQCSHDPSKCHYPEQNKRGIPIGFITRLEARLAETEQALFQVLQSLQDKPDDTSLSLKASSQRKSDRIEEWDALPLRSMSDIKAWFQTKAEINNLSLGASGVDLSDENLANPPMQRTPGIGFPMPVEETQSSERTASPLLQADGNGLLDGAWEAASTMTILSKARDLEQRHPHMYF